MTYSNIYQNILLTHIIYQYGNGTELSRTEEIQLAVTSTESPFRIQSGKDGDETKHEMITCVRQSKLVRSDPNNDFMTMTQSF